MRGGISKIETKYKLNKKVASVGFEPTRNSADDLKSPPLTARAQCFDNNF